MTSGKILVIAILVGVVGLIVFARARSGGIQQTGNSHNAVSGQANISGNLIDDLILPRLGGGTISLADFKGRKPVVLDFWASWCPNCRRDMPVLNGFYEQYKDSIEVIGINLQESEKTVQKFIDSRGISFPIALDPGGNVSRVFGIRYTNTHILVDKNGAIVGVVPGDIREEDIKSLMQ